MKRILIAITGSDKLVDMIKQSAYETCHLNGEYPDNFKIITEEEKSNEIFNGLFGK